MLFLAVIFLQAELQRDATLKLGDSDDGRRESPPICIGEGAAKRATRETYTTSQSCRHEYCLIEIQATLDVSKRQSSGLCMMSDRVGDPAEAPTRDSCGARVGTRR